MSAIPEPTSELVELSELLGVFFGAFDADGGYVEGRRPAAGVACAQSAGCPALCGAGDCPGAVCLPVHPFVADGEVLVVCHGSPAQPPTPACVRVFAQALRARREAEEEMQSTVRELASTYQELAIAYGILEAISLPSSREMIARSVLTHIASAVNATGSCFVALDEEDQPTVLASEGLSPLDLAALQAQMRSEAQARQGSEAPFTIELGETCVLACALRVDETSRGYIAVSRGAQAPFVTREAKLLRATGRQAALAIRNRALVDELHSLFVSTIQALVAAIEAKDPYTCGHSRRVAETARATAQALGLPDAQVEAIHTAAIVHDVGKIAIDTAILRKDGKLSDREWQAVRIHPERGAGIIGCVPQLRHITGAVRHHHERRDGRGYPSGLQGPQIPMEASIIAVCDSYDAMTSERPYRAAMPAQVACRELLDCAGTQFDLSVVEAFLSAVAA